jgi:hypothetical protein
VRQHNWLVLASTDETFLEATMSDFSDNLRMPNNGQDNPKNNKKNNDSTSVGPMN